jgi:hypothetical protein
MCGAAALAGFKWLVHPLILGATDPLNVTPKCHKWEKRKTNVLPLDHSDDQIGKTINKGVE